MNTNKAFLWITYLPAAAAIYLISFTSIAATAPFLQSPFDIEKHTAAFAAAYLAVRAGGSLCPHTRFGTITTTITGALLALTIYGTYTNTTDIPFGLIFIACTVIGATIAFKNSQTHWDKGEKRELPRTRSAQPYDVTAADNSSPRNSTDNPPSTARSAPRNTKAPVQPATIQTTPTHYSAPNADGPSPAPLTLTHSQTSQPEHPTKPDLSRQGPAPRGTDDGLPYLLACPRCRDILSIPRHQLFKPGRCNHCGHKFHADPNQAANHYSKLAFPALGSRTAAYIPLIPFALALISILWALEQYSNQPEPQPAAALTPEELDEIDQFVEENFPDAPTTCYISIGAWYHRPKCPILQTLREKGQPEFPTDIYSAYESGYRPCRLCKPPIPSPP